MSTTEQARTSDPLDEIRQREQAASPGPWRAEPNTGAGRVWVQLGRLRNEADCEPLFNFRTLRDPVDDAEKRRQYAQREAAAAFIAAARSDMPRLLRVAEAVRNLCRDTDGNWLEPSSPLPAGEFQAALALLDGGGSGVMSTGTGPDPLNAAERHAVLRERLEREKSRRHASEAALGIATDALRRLALIDEMAGMGQRDDDPELKVRCRHASRALDQIASLEVPSP